jgi:hypothetical protein
MWITLILILLAGGGYFTYRVTAGPRLRPVTTRKLDAGASLRFSANGAGYPALEMHKTSAALYTARWLDDACRPTGKPFKTLVMSPVIDAQREVATDFVWVSVAYNPLTAGMMNTLIWRNGRRKKLKYYPEYALHLPPPSYAFAEPLLLCDDRRYAAFRSFRITGGARPMALYDRSLKRALFSFRVTEKHLGMVFHQGDRFVMVQHIDEARVFHGGKLLATFGTWQSGWNWSEDGSVWTVAGNTIQVLDWRATPPKLMTLPMQVEFDPRIAHLENPDATPRFASAFPPGHIHHNAPVYDVAVWGGGRLVARVKTRPLLPHGIGAILDRASARFPGLRNLPRETRILTLYREGKSIGTFTARLDPLPSLRRSMAASRYPVEADAPAEHLAFTGDGRHLSWVRETPKETMEYAFPIP